MESILKQYYPDMDMTEFEREMDGIDYTFKIKRRDVVLYDTLHEQEPRCYEDCNEDMQAYYNEETARWLILDVIQDMDMWKRAMTRPPINLAVDSIDDVDNVVDVVDVVDYANADDKLYYDLLVCYLLKHGHLKSDLVEYRTLFMWDVWCLYQPQNVASYLETVEVDDLWNLHYSLSLYSYLAWNYLPWEEIWNYLPWEEIREKIRFRYVNIKEELIEVTSQPDYYFKYCLDEEERKDMNFSTEEMETLFQKPVFRRF
jgi:hypothetical protein